MSRNKFNWLSTLLLLNYAVIALFIGLAHSHETDLHFHDDCPACIWEMQSRDSDSVTGFLLDSILNPNMKISHFIHFETALLSSQFSLQSQGSRAPPTYL